jgi:uncharacterized membrane protein YbhN (UPF0104 family)
VKVTARAKRIAGWAITAAFFAAVAWLLYDRLREQDPREIIAVLRELSPVRVAGAFALTAVAYAVVASYDRLAARYARVRLHGIRGFAIAFVSYAFNFNFGATVGAVGFRVRLYSKEGVALKKIAAIAACSIVTNWCGCLTVLGAMLIADPSALRIGWGLSPTIGRLLGALPLALVAAYLVATVLRKAPVRIRGTSYPMPELPFALAQIALASGYWLLVPLAIYVLQPSSAAIPYSQLTVAYGLAALGGIVVRVPAGLGVIEAVFLEVFAGRVGAGPILAMLIAWRAVFLLAPLAIAAVAAAVLEYRGRARGGARAIRGSVNRAR